MGVSVDAAGACWSYWTYRRALGAVCVLNAGILLPLVGSSSLFRSCRICRTSQTGVCHDSVSCLLEKGRITCIVVKARCA